MGREAKIWELLRRARDLDQEAEGLRRRAGQLLRREMVDAARQEAGTMARPAGAPPARDRAPGGKYA